MTTEQEQGARTEPTLLRFRFDLERIYLRDSDGVGQLTDSLDSVVSALTGVRAVIATACLLQIDPDHRRPWDPHGVGDWFVDYTDYADYYASRVEVGRLSKASPLEVVLDLPAVVGAGSGAALGVAFGAIKLFRAYQDARIHKARADATVALYQQVATQVGLNDIVDQYSEAPQHELRQRIEQAAIALEGAETVEIQER